MPTTSPKDLFAKCEDQEGVLASDISQEGATHPIERRSVTSRTNLPTICSTSSRAESLSRFHFELADLGGREGESEGETGLCSTTRTAIEPASEGCGMPQLLHRALRFASILC